MVSMFGISSWTMICTISFVLVAPWARYSVVQHSNKVIAVLMKNEYLPANGLGSSSARFLAGSRGEHRARDLDQNCCFIPTTGDSYCIRDRLRVGSSWRSTSLNGVTFALCDPFEWLNVCYDMRPTTSYTSWDVYITSEQSGLVIPRKSKHAMRLPMSPNLLLL